MTLTICLPLPPPECSPNGRFYFMRKAKAVKVCREHAKLTAISLMNERGMDAPRWKAATVRCRFFWKDKRRHDPDNALSSVKSILDGLTDAGVWDDDRGLTHLPVVMGTDAANPRLEIDVTP